jgi:hypothetical protein
MFIYLYMEQFIENIITVGGSRTKKRSKRKQRVVGSGNDKIVIGGNTDFYSKMSYASGGDELLISLSPPEIVKRLEKNYKLRDDFEEAQRKLAHLVNTREKQKLKKNYNPSEEMPDFQLISNFDFTLPKVGNLPEKKSKDALGIEQDFYEYMLSLEDYYTKLTEITYVMLNNIKHIIRH